MLPLARIDLSEIVCYLSDFGETVALRQYDRIIEKINGLKQFPLKYAKYTAHTTRYNYRRMVVDKYLVFYVVLDNHIEIHRIIHAKKNLSGFPDFEG